MGFQPGLPHSEVQSFKLILSPWRKCSPAGEREGGKEDEGERRREGEEKKRREGGKERA